MIATSKNPMSMKNIQERYVVKRVICQRCENPFALLRGASKCQKFLSKYGMICTLCLSDQERDELIAEQSEILAEELTNFSRLLSESRISEDEMSMALDD